MSAAPRKRLACRLCTRRKVKCDKQIPCSNCVKRGTAAACERDDPDELNAPSSSSSVWPQARPDGPSTSASASAITALRSRIAELESALQHKIAEGNNADAHADAAQSPTATPATDRADRTPVPAQLESRSSSSSPTSQGCESEIQDAVTVLEFLAWGRMKDPDHAMLSPEALRVSETVNDEGTGISPAEELDCALDPAGANIVPWLQILLPSRRQVYQLVEYHNICLLWFYGSYFAPTFSEELESFYTDHHGKLDSKGLSLQWVALLFSVMAGTITSAPAHEARKWGFDESEARLLSQKWYKAISVALNAAHFTARHSLHAVQAIATATNTAHMLGHSNTQSVMLASAVRIAQSLGLHRLDEDAPGTPVELETGRRVWQELCTQDWFSTAFSESYSINPLHSTSVAPQNCDDNMNVLPESEPTITSFCRFLAKIAAIMPALQDAMALSNTLYTKHEAVLVHDRKMRSLATGRPPFLANTAFDANWPCYIPWARRAIAMSSAHKIIMIHRKFLGLSFTNPVFAFTRRTCLAASKTILKEYLASSKDESSPMLWTHQAFSVAACIVIYFDMLHSSPSASPSTSNPNYHSSSASPSNPNSHFASDQSQLVEETVEHLQLCQQKSMIAARGVKVLNALQKQIANRADGQGRSGPSKRPRSLDAATATAGTGDVPSRKRRRGFDAAEFARSFCDASTDAQRRRHGHGPSRQCQNQGIAERQTPAEHLDLGQRRIEDNTQIIGVDDPVAFQGDLNWLWNMPLNDEDGTHTFDSLLSFANQGLGL
ncbi:hypothetical protein A1O1_07684 [Capronia coronata CBS 617.96]|uniref:Zn(2)-C6 fungal-type domain-containing protein n=1 Tax=Capronia coronata CBS 617.96 TaxID=1182541 RepID=W9YH55_9EURO|nr:uncharacterized protein A1O1_07684 [Capronia coronata CBS 617.96]EXJ81619.1 hypothetical protein A1O1_07684 [Capronia coronata CBS 617.96]